MFTSKFYIKRENLPPQPPIMGTAFWFMFAHYVDAPGWIYGVIGVLLFILWLGVIYRYMNEKPKDIFKG